MKKQELEKICMQEINNNKRYKYIEKQLFNPDLKTDELFSYSKKGKCYCMNCDKIFDIKNYDLFPKNFFVSCICPYCEKIIRIENLGDRATKTRDIKYLLDKQAKECIEK